MNNDDDDDDSYQVPLGWSTNGPVVDDEHLATAAPQGQHDDDKERYHDQHDIESGRNERTLHPNSTNNRLGRTVPWVIPNNSTKKNKHPSRTLQWMANSTKHRRWRILRTKTVLKSRHSQQRAKTTIHLSSIHPIPQSGRTS
ncbi:expressed unknown protein [Seminavis robusta]|uniref:Uncharacterized protein n=1 Tax=Seminavis robusta TaxID=568900 RepID=A0A9N8E8S9_9STRA|nr:expressed unknown protein [Seminavis robusta]|eukprot:Sro634_g178930.1 n/a (142) ;mRNA; f:3955-4380